MPTSTDTLPPAGRGHRHERTLSSLEKDLNAGYRAWQRGDTARAVELLQSVLERRPGAPEAAFPLARTLSEREEPERAIALLDDQVERLDDPTGALVHRVLVRYDHEIETGLDSDLSRLGKDNPIAASVTALRSARRQQWADAGFSGFAFWNAEIAGRLLSILEMLYAGSNDDPSDTLHYACFGPVASHPGEDETAREESSRSPRSRKHAEASSFPDRKDWLAALDDAFDRQRFDDVLEIAAHEGVPTSWHSLHTRTRVVFSTLVTAKPPRTIRVARAAIEAEGHDADLEFLLGVAYARDGNALQAGHGLVRTARQEDVPVYELILALVEKLEIEIRRV